MRPWGSQLWVAPEDEDGPDPMVGKMLSGIYKVERKIGEGGMGTVYRAKHIHLDKGFAIKVLAPHIAADRQAIERLKQEAQAASSIDHHNIVDVVNMDTSSDGNVFIVMELLNGKNLADLIEKGPMPLARALHITYQVCSALHAAHEAGIVHRDLKPENVFVVRKGGGDFVKVLDFGISKVKSAEAEQVRMTKTGQLVGTPLYMSPEQARGETDVDRRVDVYAMAVMLYEMLTGEPPFDGNNYFQLLWKHGNEEPLPPTERTPDVQIPATVEAAIMRGLTKERAERFQTMDEFQEALTAAAPDVRAPSLLMSLTPAPPGLSSTPRPGRGRMMVAAAGLAALAIAGLAVALSGNEEVTAQPTPEVTPAPDPAPAPVQDAGPAEPRTVSVQFTSIPEGAAISVNGRPIGETPLVAPLPATEDAVSVVFSLARHADHTVRVIPTDGAVVRARLRRIGRGGPAQGSGPAIKKIF